LSFESRQGEDLASYGQVFYYNRAFDKQPVNAKLEAVDRAIYNPCASDDPIIRGLAEKQDKPTYFATDSVAALLMSAPKTNNAWDIIITKSNDNVFLDKRDGGPLDFWSVDENSFDPPVDASEKEGINSAQSLAIEATYINDNFIVNATNEDSGDKYDLGEPNPFHDQSSNEVPLARGYKYRKFNLANNPEEDDEIPLIVRTEIDAVQHNPTTGNDDLVSIKALNEYGGSSGTLEWKNKIVNQRGAIIATEVKNNLSKVSRWTLQSILAGAALLKIGFVSRVTPKDNTQHTILGVYTQSPLQFSNQVGVNLTNGWGILKSIVNICSELGDGKYVLIRDPNAPAIKLYKVPNDAFTGDSQ
jgi:translation initiation factor 3 subunit D